jgi:demethylmenaquinone methyltransferase/2-methoxy-6-polyprenyl-1,4-benzoquinol methylase
MPSFDHFDFIAPVYARVGEYGGLQTLLRVADMPTEGRLLDVGGGTGRVARSLRGQAGQVVLADVSLGMLRFASSIPGLQPAASASERLPFPDDSFARVVIIDALHHVADHAQTAAEMWRVLQPGGRIILIEPDIRTFGVKLIALAEKLLLMRSHFLAPQQIAELFPQAKTEIFAEDGSAYVTVWK